MNAIQRYTFPTLIALTALSVSASAAFYSVSGLSKLFAGASLEVTIMAGSLEVAKLVIASVLYQYWNTFNRLLKFYLTSAAVILVLITSMGIYGFLSAAYQETYQKVIVNENQIEFLENKAKFYEDDIARYDKELEQILANISSLSGTKATSIQVRDTTSSTGVRNTISTAGLRLAQARIEVEEENRKAVNQKRSIASDSLQKYKLEILGLQNNADTVGELGPLKYLSGLTGTPMDRIINILLLVIIFVFDPLAISLVVVANMAFEKAKPKKNLYGEYDDEDSSDKDEEFEQQLQELVDEKKQQDVREIEVIDPIEIDPKDWVIESEQHPEEEEEKVEEKEVKQVEAPKPVKRILQKSPTRRRVLFEDGSTGWLKKDDDRIVYL